MQTLSLLERLDWASRLMAAQIVVLAFLFLNTVSLPLPYAGDVRPHFLLTVIYYWVVYRPTLLPPAMVFLLGLGVDVLAGLPLGMNAFIYLAVQWIVRDQRLYLMGQPYMMVWIGFALTCMAAAAVEWGIFMLSMRTLPSPVPAAAGVVLSVFLFPLVTLLLVPIHKILPSERR